VKPYLTVLAFGLLAACTTTKEAQVRTALTDAGLPPEFAQCMAEPMARDLSTAQLRSISRVARLRKTELGRLTERQVIDLLKRDLDPETVGVVVRAGLGCFLRG
jgi:hypothetical protein